MDISKFLTVPDIRLDIKAQDREGVLAELVGLLVTSGHVTNPKQMLKDLLEREALGSTGIGHGIAFPHARSTAAKRLHFALGISRAGIPYGTLDNEPAHLILLEVAPPNAASELLQALGRVARLLTDVDLRAQLLDAQTPAQVLRLLARRGAEFPEH